MADSSVAEHVARRTSGASESEARVSLVAVARAVVRNRRIEGLILGIFLAVCLAWCIVAPRQYESRAVVALRTSPATTLRMDGDASTNSGSFASGQVQLETLAGELRSDQLAWRVIRELKLYQAPAFMGRFVVRYPNFRPDVPSADAQAYLLERFADRLRVRTIPRTLLLEVRFRCGDAALSAAVAESLLRNYDQQNAAGRVLATEKASGWLRDQLVEMKARADADDERVSQFQAQHGLLATISRAGDGQPGSVQHLPAVLQADELGKELVSASAERILREAEYRAAEQGDPELVLASDARLQGDNSALSAAAFRQIRARHSELEQEMAQLGAEHGPNFPRVVEVRNLMADLDRQLAALNAQLRDRFRSAWQTSLERERMLRAERDARTADGLKDDAAATRLEAMRGEAEATRGVYLKLRDKLDEAGVAAGMDTPAFTVTDAPRQPSRPVSPNWLLNFAIALFAGGWVAVGAGYLSNHLRRSAAVGMLLACTLLGSRAWAQAPTPNNSGLPAGVPHIHQTPDNRATPNPGDAPVVWGGGAVAMRPGAASGPSSIPGPIAPGDMVEVTEAHTPEFRTVARVTSAGNVALPLVGEVTLLGLDEPGAAKAIAAALMQRGMLLHPQVFVLVTLSGAQDVSVLGEVARPGVYAYGSHHRLLDLISSAQGLSPTAGSVVYVTHREAREASHAVALDPSGIGSADEHNPQLQPGDTVQVTRVGLVYVVGDVIRPGGFALDPTHPATVLQALSLAWGPSQTAALGKALLIREQKGGRTVTALNLKRMLRGQDPDLPVTERDIVFVPDSVAKNLWNRTMESVVQSVAGVSIYAGTVYSQRF